VIASPGIATEGDPRYGRSPSGDRYGMDAEARFQRARQ